MCKPATLVFWNVARSCRILPATQYSTCHTCLRKQDTDMFSDIKHAKTCQYTTWQKQTCQNMAVNHLKLFHNSNLPKHVSRPHVSVTIYACKHTEPASHAPNMHQCCHIFPQTTPVAFLDSPASVTPTQRETPNSAAMCRQSQTLHETLPDYTYETLADYAL